VLKGCRSCTTLSGRIAAQQRSYQLEPAAFQEIQAWLKPYRRLWTHHLDALERYLDRKESR